MAAPIQRKLTLYVAIAALLSLVIWVELEWLLPGTKVDSTTRHPQGVYTLK